MHLHLYANVVWPEFYRAGSSLVIEKHSVYISDYLKKEIEFNITCIIVISNILHSDGKAIVSHDGQVNGTPHKNGLLRLVLASLPAQNKVLPAQGSVSFILGEAEGYSGFVHVSTITVIIQPKLTWSGIDEGDLVILRTRVNAP